MAAEIEEGMREEAKPSAGGKFELLYPLGMVGGVMALIGAAMVDGTDPIAFVNLAASDCSGRTSSAVLVQFPGAWCVMA